MVAGEKMWRKDGERDRGVNAESVGEGELDGIASSRNGVRDEGEVE